MAEKFSWYELTPILHCTNPELRACGSRFSLLYLNNEEKRLTPYCYTYLSRESLNHFKATQKNPPLPKYALVLKPSLFERAHKKITFFPSDIIQLALSLPPKTGFMISISPNAFITSFISEWRKELKKTAVKDALRNIEEPFYLYKAAILFYDEDKRLRKEATKTLRSHYPFRISFKKVKVGSLKQLNNIAQIKLGILSKLAIVAGVKVPLFCPESTLKQAVLYPDPQRHPVSFERAHVHLVKSKTQNGIKIGTNQDGEDVYIPFEDLYRHTHVIGQTGSGKTNTLKIIAKRLHDAGYPVIVIDLHGEIAQSLAKTTENVKYFHPIHSPFCFNPLEPPPLENREQAILLSLDLLLNLFTNVFKLPEGAANVRYILRTVAREIYKKGITPTFSTIYEVVKMIYFNINPGIGDDSFNEIAALIRQMPEQSFISTLSRLENFRDSQLLRELTSCTTIDFKKEIEENNMLVFDFAVNELGYMTAALIASAMLMHIYYTCIRTKQKNVFVIIDEFQTLQDLPVLSTILSEARKFGLHLVISHQHLAQLNRELIDTVMQNTAVKIIHHSNTSEDFSKTDPAFSRIIQTLPPGLGTGEAILKLGSHDSVILTKIDFYDYNEIRKIDEAYTNEYVPKTPIPDPIEILNPLTKYIPFPRLSSYLIIKKIYERGGTANYKELINEFGNEAKNEITKLAEKNYLKILRKDKDTVVTLTDAFIQDFYKVSPSEKGKTLIETAVIYYLSRNYYIAPTKNIPDDRPDLIAIPIEFRRLAFENAIEIEIEATTVEKNPSRLLRHIERPLGVFKERHVWTDLPGCKTMMNVFKNCTEIKTGIHVFAVENNKIKHFEIKTVDDAIHALKQFDKADFSGEFARQKERVLSTIPKELKEKLEEHDAIDKFIFYSALCDLNEEQMKLLAEVLIDFKDFDLAKIGIDPTSRLKNELLLLNSNLKDVIDDFVKEVGYDIENAFFVASLQLNSLNSLRALRVIRKWGDRAKKLIIFAKQMNAIDNVLSELEKENKKEEVEIKNQEEAIETGDRGDAVISIGSNEEEVVEINGQKFAVSKKKANILKQAKIKNLYVVDQKKKLRAGDTLPDGAISIESFNFEQGEYLIVYAINNKVIETFRVSAL